MDADEASSEPETELPATRIHVGIQQISALLRELSSEGTSTDVRVDGNCIELSTTTSEDRTRYRIIVTEDYPEGTMVVGEDGDALEVNQPLAMFLRHLILNKGCVATMERCASQESVSSFHTCPDEFADEDEFEEDEENEEFDTDMEEEDDLRGFADSDEAGEMCPALHNDLITFRRHHAKETISFKEYHGLTEIDVDLHFNTRFLSVHAARAWNVDKEKPITVRLTLLKTHYMECRSAPSVKVFQEEGVTHGSSILILLCRVVENYINELWGTISNQMVTERQQPVQPRAYRTQRSEHAASSSKRVQRMMSLDAAIAIRPENEAKEERDGKEHVPEESVKDLSHGFLAMLYRYVRSRLPTLNEYCVICTQKIPFSSGLLNPTVCGSELCVFAHRELGLMADLVKHMSTGIQVVSLLLVTALAAASSSRNEIIFNPFPTILDPSRSRNVLLSSNDQSSSAWKLIKELVNSFPSVANVLRNKSSEDIRAALDKAHRICYPFLQWVVDSNRCHIRYLHHGKHLSFMKTPFQYLMVSQSPTVEAKFQQEKRRFGTVFAFHGSSFENWHSILRRGLMIASGTKLMVNGAAYGNGIYLSPDVNTSIGYMRHYRIDAKKTGTRNDLLDQHSLLACIALCEVVNDSAHLKKHGGSIWTCSKEIYVCTRFLFVYQNQDASMADSVNLANPQTLTELKSRMLEYTSL